MKSILLIVFGLLPGLVTTPTLAEPTDLVIKHPWVREAPPTAGVLAGYMTLINRGKSPVTMTSVNSPVFERVEMHRTSIENGIARMLPQDVIHIPPGSQVVFEPGGLHLMLIGPHQPLRSGDTVTLYLELDNGQRLPFDAPVIRQNNTGHQHTH